MNTEIIVEKVDREAAADAVKAYRDQKNNNWQERIRRGECDDGEMVQAFARHRLAERERVVAWLEGMQSGDDIIDGCKLWFAAAISRGDHITTGQEEGA